MGVFDASTFPPKAETNVCQLSQPGTFADPLTEVLRNGARVLLAQAVEAEVAALLSMHADKLTEDGRQRLVRHGHLPEREIVTGIGAVAVRCPRVRDRVGQGCERIHFSSAILPPYARRSKSLEVLIPILYLKEPAPPIPMTRLMGTPFHVTLCPVSSLIESRILQLLHAWFNGLHSSSSPKPAPVKQPPVRRAYAPSSSDWRFVVLLVPRSEQSDRL
jgi:hypothetical protein